MYVTTFYSFKGGVGRTMALVNVAVDLAGRGRRVLVVDFDLEAPGLDTFDVLRPRTPAPGIIDFVGEYLASGQAPDVERFIGETSGAFDGGGGLWVMPSGLPDTYAASFNQIDWGALYSRHDGYLLFEDLKEQWRRAVRPDYVLIDSRTGHTDTGGICTRQLPDAVAILFLPNEQNVRGLAKVVDDVRSETEAPRNKEIELHFVMSNVPDLDDEDGILEEQLDAFRRRLRFEREPMVVHRCDSLSLLNQVVFTKDRPTSRLAKEYREIVREIVRRNSADRDGALDYIREARERWRGSAGHESIKADEVLQKIEDAHSRDGEVLFFLGALREDEGRTEWAASLFDRAIDAGYDFPRAYYRRALVNVADNPEGAGEDALRVLSSDGVSPPMVRQAVRMAARRANPEEISDLKAVASLKADERIWLASALMESREENRIAASILLSVVGDEQTPEDECAAARSELSLAYIGMGKCSEAAALLRRGERTVGDMDAQDAFNYGMATWGMDGAVNAEPFARVVELDRASETENRQPNYLQRMAVAYWAVDETPTATRYASRARTAVRTLRRPAFSCWRYYRVGAAAFLEDLEEIEALIGGDASRKPMFMADAA